MAETTSVARVNKATNPTIHRTMRRAVCAEYMRDFNLERVAAMFDTDVEVIRRVVNSKTMRDHLNSTLGDTADLDLMAKRRLLEELLNEAFEPEASKHRTEARKILARHYLPRKVEGSVQHNHFLRVPEKDSKDDWQSRYTEPEPELLEAEIIEDGDDE